MTKFNKNKLQSCMKLYGDTYRTLADALGIALSTFSYKMSGKIRFSIDDIEFIALRYGLTNNEVVEIFLPSIPTERGIE